MMTTRKDIDDDEDALGAAFKRMHEYNAAAAMMTPEEVKARVLEAKKRSAKYVADLRSKARSAPIERDNSRAAQMSKRYGGGGE